MLIDRALKLDIEGIKTSWAPSEAAAVLQSLKKMEGDEPQRTEGREGMTINGKIIMGTRSMSECLILQRCNYNYTNT